MLRVYRVSIIDMKWIVSPGDLQDLQHIAIVDYQKMLALIPEFISA
jgi:hypothetical protein